MIPLNQSYRIAETLAGRPDVAEAKAEYERWAVERGLGPRGGRSYDFAVALASIDFAGKTVLELGARDSYLSPYLTRCADVTVSDGFFGFHQRGGFDVWEAKWTAAANDPDRLTCAALDMRDTGLPDESFDVVLNISAIEHVPSTGDLQSVREMARITRPGGFIVIGTDTSDELRQSGGKYYDERALYERLIEPSGCALYGPADLSWAACDKSPHKSGRFLRSCCIFVLAKP